jgi:SAM-dependent methyltransferase
MLPSPPWCVDVAEASAAGLEIRGWAIAPPGCQGAVYADGEVLQCVAHAAPREDIARIFWYLEGASHSGFVCHAPADWLDGKRTLAFSFRDAKNGAAFNEKNDYFLDWYEETPFPPPELRKRVHGHGALSSFRLEGYTTFRKLERTLSTVFGKSFRDFRSLLDWGCGCGRIARHFVKGESIAYTGVDIDGGNVAWCTESLRTGGLRDARFANCPLYPEMPLESSAFDLVIGVSVLTHLREREQLQWLEELARVSSPGAVLLLTVMGDAAVCRSALPIELFTALCAQGYLDAGNNADLDDVLADRNYYRNVFHTRDYIDAKWSRFFEIVQVVPGYVGNHQDLVVLVRR